MINDPTPERLNMRLRTALLLLLTTLSLPAMALDQQALMRIFFSVVLVRGYDTSGNLAYGSGVVVGENQVATNCHVLRKTANAWISQGEETYKIESVHVDAKHDLCLLNMEKLPFQAVELGSSHHLAKGEDVIAIGHSNGVPSPITSGGQIKALYPFEQGNVVRTNARFMMGASGSPLFNAQGKLIGINTFKTPGRVAYFYAMPVEWLAEVKKIPATSTLPVTGQAFWEFPDEQKPFFMQVALPHLNDDWAQLQEISQRWIKAEPQNSEAWFELGSAQEGLGKTQEALQSYHQATMLDPQHAQAFYRMGVIASQRGDRNEMHQVSITLAKIDGTLADEFNQAMGCNTEC